jgi:hypothetical protein
MIFFPMEALDQFMKKNQFFVNFYKNMTITFIHPSIRLILSENLMIYIIIIFQIFPRFILVNVMIHDIFFVNKIELFYKIMFIGLLPLLLLYFKYSIKRIKENLIEILEENYEEVWMYKIPETKNPEKFQEFDELDNSDELATRFEYFDAHLNLRDYFEFKIKSIVHSNFIFSSGKFIHHANEEFEEVVMCKQKIYEDFAIQKYGDNIIDLLSDDDLHTLKNKFYHLFPYIFSLGVLHEELIMTQNNIWILRTKAFIFSLYFICWSYVLFVNYTYDPIELIKPKKF